MNASAALAMKLGIASILCGILAPFALGIGIKAQREISAQPGRFSNPGSAMVGIVLGGMWSFFLAVAIVINVARGSKVSSADSNTATSPNGVMPATGATTATPSPRTTVTTTTSTAFPWITSVQSNCAAYRSAPNDIKKSAIFQANNALLASTTVTNARGKISTLATNHGGSELRLQIKVGDVEFETESMFNPIKQGSAVYNAASDMREGQCVVFSARDLKPASVSERSQVCDTEYFAAITSLGSCE